ncbi:MAG: hypothetical protein GY845_18410 [Planctomycetes bacterium]|nr:hypothetical protein [Planctomycetota bacterium]
MIRKKAIIAVFALCSSVILWFVSCYRPGGDVPEAKHDPALRSYTQEQVDDVVVMELESIYSPAPTDNGIPPEECDYIKFLRFRLRDGSGIASDADAALIMVPGVVEGANGFEYIARNLIYTAKVKNNLSLEVWAMDRRNNCLEDLTGVQAAEANSDHYETAKDLFINYYYHDLEIDGKTFDGFVKNKDAPYLSEFGLEMDTKDMYAIITTMIPDRELRRQKVFVGGHSLGGIHASMFAGWDFDGDPNTLDDAGYMNCAGLFCFDSFVTTTKETIEPLVGVLPPSILSLTENLTEEAYIKIVNGFREGWLPNIVPLLNGELLCLIEAMGLMADNFPDDEHTAIREIPYSNSVELILGLFHSRDLSTFADKTPHIKDFRYTNEALLGVLFDDDYSPLGMIQMGMGFLNGGNVVNKVFPVPDEVRDIPVVSDLIGLLAGPGIQYIANNAGPDENNLGQGPLYTWANFDEIGNAADPDYQDTTGMTTFTNMTDEITDIQDFARALYTGPSNLVEWYFSLRRIVDIMAATLSYGPKYGLNFVHSDKVGDLPKKEFVGEDGILGSDIAGKIIPFDADLIPGYSHMDPMMASANTPSHRENDVIQPLIDFILANTP